MQRFWRTILGFISLLIGLISTLLMLARLQPPQSRWLAFHSERTNGWYDIYRMYPDGSHLQPITYTEEVDTSPAWSPDSQQVAYITSLYNQQPIQVQDLVTGTIRTLPHHDYAPQALAWSPDGRWLAFSSDRYMNQELYRYGVTGEQPPQPLTDSFGSDVAPAWSGDSQQLIFASGRDLDWELYTVALSDAVAMPVAERLTHQPGYQADPVISPDGAWIAYTGFADDHFHIFRMRRDGTQMEQLTTGEHHNYAPDWSADGAWLAFVSDRDGNDEIYKIRADGTAFQRLTNHPLMDASPIWSPAVSLPWRTWLLLILSGFGLLIAWKMPLAQ